MADRKLQMYGKLLLYCTGVILLQITHVVEIQGINPNLVLVMMVIVPYIVAQLSLYGVIILYIALLLKTVPLFEVSTLGVLGMGVLAWCIKKYIPGERWLRVMLGVVLGTILFYGIVNPTILLSAPTMILKEVVYNLAIAMVGYGVMAYYYVYETEN